MSPELSPAVQQRQDRPVLASRSGDTASDTRLPGFQRLARAGGSWFSALVSCPHEAVRLSLACAGCPQHPALTLSLTHLRHVLQMTRTWRC